MPPAVPPHINSHFTNNKNLSVRPNVLFGENLFLYDGQIELFCTIKIHHFRKNLNRKEIRDISRIYRKKRHHFFESKKAKIRS